MQKSILIEKEIHDMLKNTSVKSGVTIKNLTEAAIKNYLKKIKISETEDSIIIPKVG